MGKGLMTLNPYHSDHTLLNGGWAPLAGLAGACLGPASLGQRGGWVPGAESGRGSSWKGGALRMPLCSGRLLSSLMALSRCCPHVTRLPAGTALAGILAVLLAGGLDMKSSLAGKQHYLLYCLTPAMKPRMLMTGGWGCAPLGLGGRSHSPGCCAAPSAACACRWLPLRRAVPARLVCGVRRRPGR